MIRSLLARAEARIPSVSAAAQQFGIYRKRRREVEDADGSYAETLKSQPQQTIHLEFQDFRMALAKLPVDQREGSFSSALPDTLL
jgi:hypothetical protein